MLIPGYKGGRKEGSVKKEREGKEKYLETKGSMKERREELQEGERTVGGREGGSTRGRMEGV